MKLAIKGFIPPKVLCVRMMLMIRGQDPLANAPQVRGIWSGPENTPNGGSAFGRSFKKAWSDIGSCRYHRGCGESSGLVPSWSERRCALPMGLRAVMPLPSNEGMQRQQRRLSLGGHRRSGSALPNRLLCEGIISTMRLKDAALFALIGMILLTILLGGGFHP